MWSINELLFREDFKGMFDKSEYELMSILKEEPKLITNKKYYIRFKHDFKDISFDKSYPNFEEKYKRRMIRLKQILSSDESILFIRYEEENDKRIKYKYEKHEPEVKSIYKFIELMKTKFPKKKFMFLQISNTTEANYIDEANNLIVIKMIGKITEWNECVSKIRNTLVLNSKFLNEKIK